MAKKAIDDLVEKMPPCPICGKKAYIMHIVVDGVEYGYSAGCPSYCLNDGVHGITESFDPEAPSVDGYTAEQAFYAWIDYCNRKNGTKDESKEKKQ